MGHSSNLDDVIISNFGHRLRMRVSGLVQIEEKILLVQHQSLGAGRFWAPPGGGCEYGESLHQCLQREFKEETGLGIIVNDLLSINEYLSLPLHAIELFFSVSVTGGNLKLGMDPELPVDKQILTKIATFSISDLQAMAPDSLHSMFHKLKNFDELFEIKSQFSTNADAISSD